MPYADLGEEKLCESDEKNSDHVVKRFKKEADDETDKLEQSDRSRDVSKSDKLPCVPPDVSKINPNPQRAATEETCNFKTAVPFHQMPGHTGYLTFASLYLD